jgi:hypothetical protein
MILDFKEEDGIRSSAISRKKAPPQASRPTTVTDVVGNILAEPADDSPIVRAVSHYGSKGTPPVEIRAGRYSALKTASGSQRSLSSISGTQDSARSTLNTRSSDGGGYDSDSVDVNDIDEEDNAYVPVLLDKDTELGHSDDEYEGDATDAVPAPAGAGDTYGKYVNDLYWKLEEVESNSVPFENTKALYVGKTVLRNGVSDSFVSPFECFKKCGGCDDRFVGLLAQHSNDYMKVLIREKYPKENPHGLVWKDITTAEMYRFLGIMLKISISPIDGGGLFQ